MFGVYKKNFKFSVIAVLSYWINNLLTVNTVRNKKTLISIKKPKIYIFHLWDLPGWKEVSNNYISQKELDNVNF